MRFHRIENIMLAINDIPPSTYYSMCILRYRNIFTFTFQIGHADKMEIIELRLQNSRYQSVVGAETGPGQATVHQVYREEISET